MFTLMLVIHIILFSAMKTRLVILIGNGLGDPILNTGGSCVLFRANDLGNYMNPSLLSPVMAK